MVSFKTAQHIDPSAAASRVRSHEQEHVSNVYKDAAQNNEKVLQASVSIKTVVCPKCGKQQKKNPMGCIFCHEKF